ncbi:hypothetical protein GHT06_006615 [Daphnia sinensis]|uniref:Uncharacterized protein n=1 Tax=Daphnia sinensis TaxID=1820382 RepID=A0AAD5PJT9_9CRUS|nr:hypothetical protein GHT06_006645 [Daphnia sinensis]KAI9549316.1 hypothetical protein GHT06_006615 [Daphnia sinensis]
MVRESASLEVSKCVYTRMGWPSRNGGLERAFIHWAQADTQVLAFCKISENRHTFARLRYVKDDGLPAFYSPDFLVRPQARCTWSKPKAKNKHPPQRATEKSKPRWHGVERINNLTEEQRGGPPWHYVLLGEAVG